jgi:hypothetical protein
MRKDHLPCFNSAAPVLIALALHCSPGRAEEINKCRLNGQITYTDRACPKDATALPFSASVAPPSDPNAAQQRFLSDQKQLQQITKQHEQLERQQASDAKKIMRQARSAQDQELRCKKLDAKRKSARLNSGEIRRKGNSKKNQQAQLQVQLAEDKFSALCSSDQ